ncbi:DJ-1/PfpI family protein [Xanthomonas campestris pv. zinniae]|nr:DJ-1/PfpI family protein [Xanthomonas campestris pv. zinniae]
MKTLGGCQLQTPATLDRLDDADVIVIPGWRNPDECPPTALLDKLRAAHARGARLASICSGAFVLAHAGLLDGLSATTYWRLTDLLASRFPRIEVRANVLYVDTGSILTSAGSATGMDMMLHMVRKDNGTCGQSGVATAGTGTVARWRAQPAGQSFDSVRRTEPARGAHRMDSQPP